MANAADAARILADLPEALRVVLEAELAAGNSIREIGTGFPAAPIGFWVKFSRPFQRAQTSRPAGVGYYERNTTDWSEEVYDGARHFFLLSPPEPIPEPPSMDEIRAAHTPSPLATQRPDLSGIRSPLSGLDRRGWWIELDGRGETITYREADRWAEVFWGSMTSGAIERASLRGWFSSGPTIPMTAAEQQVILDRIVESARIDHRLVVTLR